MSVDFSVSHCLYTISMYTFTAGPKVPLLTVSKDKVRADRHRIREQEREAQSLERECKSRSYHDESSIISAEQGMLVLDRVQPRVNKYFTIPLSGRGATRQSAYVHFRTILIFQGTQDPSTNVCQYEADTFVPWCR